MNSSYKLQASRRSGSSSGFGIDGSFVGFGDSTYPLECNRSKETESACTSWSQGSEGKECFS